MSAFTPHEVRKTIALVAGIVLTGVGVPLLWQGVQGGASIDLSAGLVIGKIESGSAGVLLCFLGVVIILASSFGRGAPSPRAEIRTEEEGLGGPSPAELYFSRWRNTVMALWGLVLLLTLGAYFLPSLPGQDPEGPSLLVLAAVLLTVGNSIATLALLGEWVESARRGKVHPGTSSHQPDGNG